MVFLAACGRGGASREKLIGYFWPDRDPTRGRNLLDQALSAARRTFGPQAVVANQTTVALDPDAASLDLVAFDAAVERKAWSEAVGLYAGPLLDGVVIDRAPAFAQWVEVEAARCARSYADALEHLARDAAGRGRPTEAVDYWQRLVVVDPLSARAVSGLMGALAATGQRGAALDLARVYDGRVAQAFGAAPDPTVARLADTLRRAAPAPPASAPPISARRRGMRIAIIVSVLVLAGLGVAFFMGVL